MAASNKLVIPARAGDRVVKVNVSMLKSTRDRLKAEAAARECTISDLIAEALAARPHEPIGLDGDAGPRSLGIYSSRGAAP